MPLYKVRAPALPLPTPEYLQAQQDQFQNVLRLYFNRVDNALFTLSGPTGGAALEFPYGAFYSTATKTAAAINTAYPITLNSTTSSNNIDLDATYPSRMVAAVGGVYNFQVSIQMTNQTATSTNGYIWVWGRLNGTDIPYSTSKIELSGTSPDEVHFADTFVVELAPSEYFEVCWATDNLDCKLLSEVATSFAPASNSINVTATCVSAVYA